MILASFLSWRTYGYHTATGLDLPGFAGLDRGVITILIGSALLGMSLAIWLGSLREQVDVIGMLGLGAAAIVLWTYVPLMETRKPAEIGVGLVLLLVGAVLGGVSWSALVKELDRS